MVKYLLQVLAVSVLVATVYSCTCMPATFPEKYCRADYVARVQVLNNGAVIGMNRVYKVQVEYFYKSNVNTRLVDTSYLFTATNSAACGVILQEETTYIITGYYDRNSRGRPIRRMRTSLCDDQILYSYRFRQPICRRPINSYSSSRD